MRLLLDTQSFLWFLAGDTRLSKNARQKIADLDNEVYVSIGSLWEIAIKSSLGKLNLSKPFESFIPEQLEENEIEILHIRLDDLSQLFRLPFHHRDPFDRLIIAQAIIRGMPVVTSDDIFSEYEVKLLDKV